MNTCYSEKRLLFDGDSSNVMEDSNYRIIWKGFVFINGYAPGKESFKVFIKNMRNDDIKSACRTLKGIYFIALRDKSSGTDYFFVDNSGLFQSFYTGDTISTSFLELIKYKNYNIGDFDPYATVEFLHLGNIYSDRTFIKSIKKIPWNKIIQFTNGDKELQSIDKEIPNIDEIDEVSPKSFEEVMEYLSCSLRSCKVSIDLTGGIDSRLLAIILDYYGLEFETAISGEDDYHDVLISRQVAKVIGHPWYCTNHSIVTIEDDMKELFRTTDGLLDVLIYHRLLQHQKARRSRGIDLMISGVGGELFKDFWWLQDFPFYCKKSADLERLVAYRIMPQDPSHNILDERLQGISEQLRGNIVHELTQYILPMNTRTYDNIYFNYRCRGLAGRFLTANSSCLQCYAPYIDIDTARIGFNLQRRLRFFNIFHRKLLTSINPSIASMPTTEGGISSSMSMKIIVTRDLKRYVADKMNRLSVKIRQRLQKNVSFESPNNPHLYQFVRSLKILNESIRVLNEANILNRNMKLDLVDNRYLGRFLSLALLIRHMASRTIGNSRSSIR